MGPFSGNPAAVCPLEGWLDDATLLNIAAENNLSETAFIVATDKGYALRWFTPAIEVDLCGHATLAAAHILFQELEYKGDVIEFDSRSGLLAVKCIENQYQMDFPVDEVKESELP